MTATNPMNGDAGEEYPMEHISSTFEYEMYNIQEDITLGSAGDLGSSHSTKKQMTSEREECCQYIHHCAEK